jgi:hypothetical protein
MRAVAVTDISDPQRNNVAIAELAILSANLAYSLQQSQGEGALDEAISYNKLSVNARQRMRPSPVHPFQETRHQLRPV